MPQRRRRAAIGTQIDAGNEGGRFRAKIGHRTYWSGSIAPDCQRTAEPLDMLGQVRSQPGGIETVRRQRLDQPGARVHPK